MYFVIKSADESDYKNSSTHGSKYYIPVRCFQTFMSRKAVTTLLYDASSIAVPLVAIVTVFKISILNSIVGSRCITYEKDTQAERKSPHFELIVSLCICQRSGKLK